MAKGSVNGKDPAVSWYWNDWAGGTMGFTRHQKGCYMDLLCAQFNLGTLSLDEIKNVLGSDFGHWPAISKKFEKDESGNYYNVRLMSEIVKRKGYNKSRTDNLSGGDHMGIDNGKDFELDIDSILEYLNTTARVNFKKSADCNRKPLRARLREGFVQDDFLKVIEHKVETWGQDDKMREYLRPTTLFSVKFEGYLQAAKAPKVGVNGTIHSHLDKHKQQEEELKAKYGK